MLNISFWNMAGVVVEVLLLYICLKKFLFGKIQAIQEKRREMVSGQIQEAKDRSARALEFKNQYETKMASAQEEAGLMIEENRKNAQFEYDRILKQANSEAGSMLNKARLDIELEREKAMREMESQVADLALSAASRIIGEKAGAECDRLLYEQFIKKAGESDDRDLN